jgi:hypothetical protein
MAKKLSEADEQIEGVIMKPAGFICKAAKSQKGREIGGWVFVIGFLIAVIAGLAAGLTAAGMPILDVNATSLLMGVMALIGLIVGIVNISDKEAINFLIGAIAVTAAAGAMAPLANLGSGVAVVGQVTNFVAAFIGGLMQMIATFVAPAAVIVALKVIYSTARGA